MIMISNLHSTTKLSGWLRHWLKYFRLMFYQFGSTGFIVGSSDQGLRLYTSSASADFGFIYFDVILMLIFFTFADYKTFL